MRRESMIRLVSFTTAAFVVLAGFTVKYRKEAADNARLLQYSRDRAMMNLFDSLSTIADTLEKEKYCYSPGLRVSMAAKIWREAGSAAAALGELPLNSIMLDKTSRFIAQAGDYSYYLAKKAARGYDISADEQETIARLGQIARDCALELSIQNTSKVDSDTVLSPDNSFSRTISQFESDFPDYPVLIYDGPLSDHIERAQPALLEGKKNVSVQTACEKAADMIDVAQDRFKLSGKSEGRIPAYCFTAETDRSRWYCNVSVIGGVVTDWGEMREIGESTISVDEAVRRAEQYLHTKGITAMEKTYYLDEDGIVLVNFAAVQDGVILYPDLIKVGIARDTGDVVRYEANGYVMCHCRRELAEPGMSAEEAFESLRDQLTVESTRLALIPTDGEYEILCHEYLCSDEDGMKLLVYCDAQSGEEIQIYVLIENENGTLTV